MLTLFTEFNLNVLLTEENPHDRRGTPVPVRGRQQTVKHELPWPLTASEGPPGGWKQESDHWVEKSGKLGP